MQYPRPGEPIVPRLLRSLVVERRPSSIPFDQDTDLLAHDDLGADVWARLPPEICRRVSLLVVDRVQTRLGSLPDAIRDTRLPSPEAALALPLEHRTINTLRRAVGKGSAGQSWTVGRYIGIRRFGGRALVDLLAAFEAHAPSLPRPAMSRSGTDGALQESLLMIARQAPIAEDRLDLGSDPSVRTVDVTHLLRTATQLGHELPFRVIKLGGTRVVVRLSELTAAHATYRIAVHAVRAQGAATLDGIAARVRAATHSPIGRAFVESLLSGLSGFRWLDQQDGWFWFAQRSNPLVASVRKVLSVVARLPLARLMAVLFRTRPGLRPSLTAVQGLCRAVPEARITGGIVMVDRLLDRRAHLNQGESRVVKFLEIAGGGLSNAQIRWLIHEIGMPWTPIWRLLRSSPLFERSPDGLFRLVGSN